MMQCSDRLADARAEGSTYEFYLKGSGVTVDLLHIESGSRTERCLVELEDGTRLLVPAIELASRAIRPAAMRPVSLDAVSTGLVGTGR